MKADILAGWRHELRIVLIRWRSRLRTFARRPS